MSKLNLKFKLDIIKIINISRPLSLVLIVAVLSYCLYFLHQNVYLTIAQAEILTELKKEVPDEDLQIKTFQEELIQLERKIQATSSELTTRNPFLYEQPINPDQT